MDKMSSNPAEPFILLEGDTREIALHNRILAIGRVNWLVQQTIPGFDIYEKSDEYRFALDKELAKRFYVDTPQAKIDEEFCQRMARVCLEFEGMAEEAPEKTEAQVPEQPLLQRPPKRTIIQKFVNWLNKHEIKL